MAVAQQVASQLSGIEVAIRKEALRIEKIANIFRAAVVVFAVVTVFTIRHSIPRSSVVAVYIAAAVLTVHTLTLALILSRKRMEESSWFRPMQFISSIVDVAIISATLWALGEFRTFKSHIFQVYFLFIALASFRYSRPLTIFTAILTTSTYVVMFMISILTERVDLGSLSQEYNGPVISVIGIVIKSVFLILVSMILSRAAKGYSNVIRRVRTTERESEQRRQEAKSARLVLARYFNKEVAEYIIENEFSLSGENREVTIMFCDFRGFSALSNTLSTRDTVELLNAYLSEMVKIIFQYYGTLDKYTGDGFMAVFGAPLRQENDTYNALAAAVAIRKCVQRLNESRGASPKLDMGVGMGISTGDVIAGNIGSSQRLEYTVIGEAVNLASRLERLNKKLNSTILISQSTYLKTKQGVQADYKGAFRIRGITEIARVYELRDVSPLYIA